MEIIIKPNMKIIVADIGHMLYNTVDNTYCQKVYMPLDSSTEHFEEVIDETVSDSLRLVLERIKDKERSLNKIGKMVAQSITDDVQAL